MAYVPISQELLGNKHWVRHSSIAFAKDETIAPLFINELSDALQALPIAFIKQGECFVLVVVMGLRPGENLCVSDTNTWLSPYMPVIYRSSPFDFRNIQGQEDQSILCIDDRCVTDPDRGEPFFDEQGNVTENIVNAFEFTRTLNTHKVLTDNVCALLNEYSLIEPWPLVIKDEEHETEVNGLYSIDETALNKLPIDALIKLRDAHALPLAYAQLFSMSKSVKLGQALSKKMHKEALAMKSKDNDVFNFSGL